MCAEMVVAQGEEAGGEALECLKRGYVKNGAELAVAAPNVEGDLTANYFPGHSAGPSPQILSDCTRDGFGGGGWEDMTWPLPDGKDSLEDCL